MTTGRPGRGSWIRFIASIPDRSGIDRSMMTMSGSSSSASVHAATPPPASPATSMSATRLSADDSALRNAGWSSTTSTRTGVSSPYVRSTADMGDLLPASGFGVSSTGLDRLPADPRSPHDPSGGIPDGPYGAPRPGHTFSRPFTYLLRRDRVNRTHPYPSTCRREHEASVRITWSVPGERKATGILGAEA